LGGLLVGHTSMIINLFGSFVDGIFFSVLNPYNNSTLGRFYYNGTIIQHFDQNDLISGIAVTVFGSTETVDIVWTGASSTNYSAIFSGTLLRAD